MQFSCGWDPPAIASEAGDIVKAREPARSVTYWVWFETAPGLALLASIRDPD